MINLPFLSDQHDIGMPCSATGFPKGRHYRSGVPPPEVMKIGVVAPAQAEAHCQFNGFPTSRE
jgi:hypothetical protein